MHCPELGGEIMRRREFITLVGGAAATWTFATHARLLMVAVVAAASVFFTAGATRADPYKWCAVDNSGGGTNCGFVTLEQCRATISGKGGSCEPRQVIPQNLSPAAKFAAPKTDTGGGNGKMDCVTASCKINCSPNVARRFRPKWCVHFKEPV